MAERFLASRLRSGYPGIAFRGHRGRYAAERCGILSRFPLKGARFVPPGHGLFGFLLARVQVGGRAVQIANLHLQPVNFAGVGDLRELLIRANDTEAIHVREIEQVLAELEPALPTIVAGDFNSLSWFVAPAQLEARGFRDSFAGVYAQPERHPTLRWPFGSGHLQLRIDYIFHDASFETRTSRVLCNDASDHCLLVSELRLAP